MKKLLSVLIVGVMLALPFAASAASCPGNTLSDLSVNVNTILADMSKDCVIANLVNNETIKNLIDNGALESLCADILAGKAGVIPPAEQCGNTGCDSAGSCANGACADVPAADSGDFWNNVLTNINSGKAGTGWNDLIGKISEPAPKPAPEPTPEPAPEPTPDPAPKPAPEPAPKPAPEPAPKPAPEPAPTDNPLSAYINEVVRLVNEQRAANGLSALKTDATLMRAAQKRAEEIVVTFSHTRPNGTSTFTALDEFGVNYRGAGENIAMGQSSPAEVMNGWMNSQGHRENILKASFTHIGVGCYRDASGRLYWTQFFTY